MNESDRRIDGWAEQLRGLAAPALAGTPLESGADRSRAGAFVGAFADSRGHRRAVDRPLLARMLAVDPGPSPDDATPEARLWWALHTPDANPWAIIDPGPGAPLLASRRRGIIETDTESELSALHALWHHAAERRCPRLLAAALVQAHRQLLRQQLVELDPPPGRVGARLQRFLRDVGGRVVQGVHAVLEGGEAVRLQQ